MAAWFAAWVAGKTEVQLDDVQISAFMVTVATSALASAWKWFTGWQQHELLVAHGLDVPRVPGPNAPMAPSDDKTSLVRRMVS